MKSINPVFLLAFWSLAFISCSPAKVNFERPVDTSSKNISYQNKTTYVFKDQNLSFSNQFNGARLNGVKQLNDSLYRLYFKPENIPINNSSYYAFDVQSNIQQTLYLQFSYPPPYTHRYVPKIYRDGVWENSSSEQVDTTGTYYQLILPLKGKARVAAQEIQNSQDVANWVYDNSQAPYVQWKTIGKSKLGRPMWVMDIAQGNPRGKPIVVFLTRQHPPEVTGYLAFKSFMETLLEENDLSTAFLEQYHVLAFPMVNPDGVDLGHWRHNAGGIDTNRDWSEYRQPEVRAIVKYIEKTLRKEKANLVLGLDFHSTWYDVFYTNKEREKTPYPTLLEQWFRLLEKEIPHYSVNEKASNSTQPVSKGWLLYGHSAVGVTYEIGDETPRDSIQLIGETSARALMELLVKK